MLRLLRKTVPYHAAIMPKLWMISTRTHISEHGYVLQILVETGSWQKLSKKNKQDVLDKIVDDIEDGDSYTLFPFAEMGACSSCFKVGKLAYVFDDKWEEVTYCKNCLYTAILEQIMNDFEKNKDFALNRNEIKNIIQEWDVSPAQCLPFIMKSLKQNEKIIYDQKTKKFIRK